MSSPTLDLTIDLIRRQSVTPQDEGCQKAIADRLEKAGFSIEHLDFEDTNNLWAKRGSAGPLLVFVGHTDVVPAGPLESWQSPPFEPSIRDGFLFGRGAADMKSGVAAMVTASERFVKAHASHTGSIAFLITSDEEGKAVNGTSKALGVLTERGEKMDYCVVGEPSCVERLGDTIKVGRRGSFHANITIHGTGGHIAYPARAKNPIHLIAKPLADLCQQEWDKGNEYFPPTSYQVSNIHAGDGTVNVIPEKLEIKSNFRFSTATTPEKLKERVASILDKYDLKYTLDCKLFSSPFLTQPAELVTATQAAIKSVCGSEAEASTSGGTSDGRFFAALGAQVIELGPVNASMHKSDECVNVKELQSLSEIYEKILENLLG
jgi:succinyl-diaminopimelate desuccinylase